MARPHPLTDSQKISQKDVRTIEGESGAIGGLFVLCSTLLVYIYLYYIKPLLNAAAVPPAAAEAAAAVPAAAQPVGAVPVPPLFVPPFPLMFMQPAAPTPRQDSTSTPPPASTPAAPLPPPPSAARIRANMMLLLLASQLAAADGQFGVAEHEAIVVTGKFDTQVQFHHPVDGQLELPFGIAEHEAVVAAAVTIQFDTQIPIVIMEQIFQGTKSFKQAVFENFKLKLKLYIYNANVKQLVDVPWQENFQLKLKLHIYNANVNQLVDVPCLEYFSYLGQKTQQCAVNQAKVDVAAARMSGAVGAKEREGTTLQKAAEVDPQTKAFRVRQEAIGIKEQTKAFRVRQEAIGIKEQAKVEVLENEKEGVVADAKADLATDTQVHDSNAALYSRRKAAKAKLYEQQKAAEGRKAQADAQFFEQKLAEDAKQKVAESLATVGKAKVDYVAWMLQVKALGGNYHALRNYMMIDGGLYQEMARINAGAVSGMQPKISIVWTKEAAN